MIVNASPLIIFSKIDKLDLLEQVFGKLKICREVYTEIVRKGMKIKAPDAYLIKEYIDSGKIQIIDLDQEGLKEYKKLTLAYKQLDIGEAATIALVIKEGETEILIDERIARKIASLKGLTARGSLRVLILAYNNKIINEKQLHEILINMLNARFRVSAAVIERFWQLFEHMKRKYKKE